MIKQVIFINHKDERMSIGLDGVGTNGLVIMSMTGIGPVKGDINMTELVTSDGSVFNSARINTRNITIQFKLLPTPNMENTRKALYKFFGVKKKITVWIETELRTLAIDGYVEADEVVVFTNREVADVSIVCPDPYFYDPIDLTTTFFYENPLFEFPFNDEETRGELFINDGHPIPFGEIVVHDWEVLDYNGDGDTGVVISLYTTGTVKNPIIVNRNTRESISIDTTKMNAIVGGNMHLTNGDKVVIDTNVGNKTVKLVRGGVTYNILNCIDRRADWFVITAGENVFVASADEGADNMLMYLETRVRYEGV